MTERRLHSHHLPSTITTVVVFTSSLINCQMKTTHIINDLHNGLHRSLRTWTCSGTVYPSVYWFYKKDSILNIRVHPSCTLKTPMTLVGRTSLLRYRTYFCLSKLSLNSSETFSWNLWLLLLDFVTNDLRKSSDVVRPPFSSSTILRLLFLSEIQGTPYQVVLRNLTIYHLKIPYS